MMYTHVRTRWLTERSVCDSILTIGDADDLDARVRGCIGARGCARHGSAGTEELHYRTVGSHRLGDFLPIKIRGVGGCGGGCAPPPPPTGSARSTLTFGKTSPSIRMSSRLKGMEGRGHTTEVTARATGAPILVRVSGCRPPPEPIEVSVVWHSEFVLHDKVWTRPGHAPGPGLHSLDAGAELAVGQACPGKGLPGRHLLGRRDQGAYGDA